MSILIKGMDMPKNCKACVCSNYYDRMDMFMCDITNEQIDEKQWKRERHPNCPLIELPPHGRLIDADEIEMPCLETTADQKWMEIAIKSTPTIIEAEGSE